MPMKAHNLDCSCGQPADLVATAIAAHCPRCGRTISRSSLHGGEYPASMAGAASR